VASGEEDGQQIIEDLIDGFASGEMEALGRRGGYGTGLA
jgi:hypothetical protein